MTARDRVVFDCNVYFQAIISPFGPAGRLFSFAAARRFDLFFSAYVLGELHELTADDRIRSKYQLNRTSPVPEPAAIAGASLALFWMIHRLRTDRRSIPISLAGFWTDRTHGRTAIGS